MGDSINIWHSDLGAYPIPDDLFQKSKFRKDGGWDGRYHKRNKEMMEWVKKLDAEAIKRLGVAASSFQPL